MKYNKCIKCELNYVEKEGDMCNICKDCGAESGVCVYCGGITLEGRDICEICLESLSLTEHENIFIDEEHKSVYDD